MRTSIFHLMLIYVEPKHHSCPVKHGVEPPEAMTGAGFQPMEGVSDLNGKMAFRAIAGGNLPGVAYECRQDAVRPIDGLPALEDIPSHR